MPSKYKFTDPTKILTLANFISLGRAILAVPIIYTLQDPKMGTVSFLLIIIAVLSDALDGWVARKAHEVTHFGKWIDPIADFACIISVVSYLTLVGRFPDWFFIFFLVRYVFIAISAIHFLNNNIFVFIIFSSDVSTFSFVLVLERILWLVSDQFMYDDQQY